MLSRFTAVAALAACVFVAACDDDNNGTGPQDFGALRVVNAASSAQAIDVYSDGSLLASNIAFLSGTSTCFDVEAGTPALEIRNAGTANAIATLNDPVAANTDYTLVLMGNNDATLLTDQFTAPNTGEAAIRFINATGAAVDIYASDPNAGAIGTTPTSANLAVSATSDFINIPEANTRFTFTTVGTQTPLFEISNFTLPTSRVATVVLTQDAQSAYQFVAVEPCS
jgi:hypothetical protein